MSNQDNSVNVTNPKIDTTVRIFDDFYAYESIVPGNEYDAIYAFFKVVMNDDKVAQNFTTTLFRVASATNVSAIVLLQQLQAADSLQLTVLMAYYLNGIRSPSTLLGIHQVATPNYYTARNVRS
jgi:hypothetical protein